MKEISVIGAGSWGTTLAIILGKKGFKVKLWARRKELSEQINSSKENSQYLPGIIIPDKVLACHSLKESANGADMIVMAVPSEFLRNIAKSISHFYKGQIVLSATKGIEHDSCKRMSQVIEEEFGKKSKIAVVSGPNHSEELSIGMPTASVVASTDKRTAKSVEECLATPYFRLYRLKDVEGVEICGALKNISAIATGVSDGFGFGDNTKASIITLGLMEMNNFGRHFGAKRSTVYGLAGVGDLIATCTSSHSRNRFVGEQLAKGKTIEEIKKRMHGMIAEGIGTTKAVHEYSIKHKVEMPLTQQAYKVLFENKNIKQAIKDLLSLV